MIEKLFKSLFIKIAAGAIVLFVIIFGLFLFGRKPTQSSIMNTEKLVAMKIPKSNPTVEPSVKKISEKMPTSEKFPETTIEEKNPEPDEILLNPEDPFESEEADKAESISVEGMLEEEANAETISAEETPEEGEVEKSISSHETDPFSGMEAGGEITDDEPVEEAGLRMSKEPEAEKPAVNAQPETETEVTEKKSSFFEHKGKRIIRDIVLSESGSEQKLIFKTDSPVRKYKYFILSNPPRLVVDLPGVWKDPDFLEKKVDSNLISRIRLWKHGDKLRIVNDLKSDKTLFPVFTKSSDGVEVVLKTR